MTAAVVNGSPHTVTVVHIPSDSPWRAHCRTCTWRSAMYAMPSRAETAAQNHAEVTGNGEWLTP